jgi:hypothetical protein
MPVPVPLLGQERRGNQLQDDLLVDIAPRVEHSERAAMPEILQHHVFKHDATASLNPGRPDKVHHSTVVRGETGIYLGPVRFA